MHNVVGQLVMGILHDRDSGIVLGSIWWDRLLANPESTAATHSVGLRFGSFSKLDIKLYALSLTVCLMKVSAILLV